MGLSTDGMQTTLREEIEAENAGAIIPMTMK
jgi:hypothetical protein